MAACSGFCLWPVLFSLGKRALARVFTFLLFLLAATAQAAEISVGNPRLKAVAEGYSLSADLNNRPSRSILLDSRETNKRGSDKSKHTKTLAPLSIQPETLLTSAI